MFIAVALGLGLTMRLIAQGIGAVYRLMWAAVAAI
jgi:hypothetical protein